jgi:MYXO-CTERM domain-containing protein
VTGFTPCEVLKAWEVEHGSTTGGETETSTSTSDTGTGTTDTSTTDRPEPGSTGAPEPGSTADSGEVTTTVTGSDSAAESKGETGDIVGESSSGPGGTSSGGSSGSGGVPGDTAASDDDKACACRSDADPGGQALGVLASLAGLGLLGGRRRQA